MKKTNNKGFSLVELIIVIAIMAILIGVLAPQYIKYVEKSRISSDKDMVDSITKAVQTACTDEDYYDALMKGTDDKVDISASGLTISTNLQAAMTEYYGTSGGSDTTKKFKSKAFNGKTISVKVEADTTTATTLKVVVYDGDAVYDPTGIK